MKDIDYINDEVHIYTQSALEEEMQRFKCDSLAELDAIYTKYGLTLKLEYDY